MLDDGGGEDGRRGDLLAQLDAPLVIVDNVGRPTILDRPRQRDAEPAGDGSFLSGLLGLTAVEVVQRAVEHADRDLDLLLDRLGRVVLLGPHGERGTQELSVLGRRQADVVRGVEHDRRADAVHVLVAVALGGEGVAGEDGGDRTRALGVGTHPAEVEAGIVERAGRRQLDLDRRQRRRRGRTGEGGHVQAELGRRVAAGRVGVDDLDRLGVTLPVGGPGQAELARDAGGVVEVEAERGGALDEGGLEPLEGDLGGAPRRLAGQRDRLVEQPPDVDPVPGLDHEGRLEAVRAEDREDVVLGAGEVLGLVGLGCARCGDVDVEDEAGQRDDLGSAAGLVRRQAGPAEAGGAVDVLATGDQLEEVGVVLRAPGGQVHQRDEGAEPGLLRPDRRAAVETRRSPQDL